MSLFGGNSIMKKTRITLICLAAALLFPVFLLAFSGCDYVRGEGAPDEQSASGDQRHAIVLYLGEDSLTDVSSVDELEIIRERFPEYFELNPADGIDIIVWQMAKDSYSFAMRPHEEGRTIVSIEEVDSFKGGLNVNQMKKLIAARKIDKNDVTIIPWSNPLSSYGILYSATLENDGNEEIAEKNRAYIRTVEEILFGDAN